jgi:hypothetical protein
MHGNKYINKKLLFLGCAAHKVVTASSKIPFWFVFKFILW